MKNKFIKNALYVALILALMIGAADFSCGEKGSMASNDTSYVTAINIYRPSFNLEEPNPVQVKKVQDAINDYLKGRINVKINLTDVGASEYVEAANLALENKEVNLLWTASWEPSIGTNDLVTRNAVFDLTDILAGTDLYASMDSGSWEATKYGGRNYFIPVYKDNVEGYDYMFRQELVDRYGWDITSVKELADLEPMLKEAKEEGIKYPFLTQKTAMFYRWYIDDFDFFTADATADWVAVDKSSGEVVDTILTPQYKDFCTLMADWAQKGYISEDDINNTTSETVARSKDWAVTWWTDIPVNDEADSRYGQDVSIQPATDRWAHSTSALGSCYCVTADSTPEQARACLDFLGLMYTDSKLADLYTFGIEGEDYTYDANGQVVQTSDKYNHSMWESASATIVTPLNNEPADKADLYKDFNGGARTSPAAGFRFDKTPVETQFAACQCVFEEYGFLLENGGVAVSEVDQTIRAYQAALDGAGYQDILAEFQRQYEAWK
ncbi:MAG: ABC transporter substrate-binding protein [Lachnospiraceae bacterium]|nr:ABC transporter substrate-binding protein [Lachnospiraceae bacterium]